MIYETHPITRHLQYVSTTIRYDSFSTNFHNISFKLIFATHWPLNKVFTLPLVRFKSKHPRKLADNKVYDRSTFGPYATRVEIESAHKLSSQLGSTLSRPCVHNLSNFTPFIQTQVDAPSRSRGVHAHVFRSFVSHACVSRLAGWLQKATLRLLVCG